MSDPVQRQIQRLDAAGATAYLLRELYQEGTWTPAFGGTSTSGTITYVANGQLGRYVRIGAIVIAEFYLDIDALSVAPTGLLTITGLPFTATSDTNALGYGQVVWNNVDLTAGCVQLVPRVSDSETRITFIESFDAAVAGFLAASAISASTLMTGLVVYMTK